MKISEIITDKYKLRIPPTVYYDLLADVVEAEEEQEPRKDEVILTNKEYREITSNEYDHGYCKGYTVALEEQKSILDKIRAEINSPNRGTCDYFIVDRIEEIIDKYMAESEG